ncbi:hypothetical protein DRH27_03025 [Candidatus Falkowbacteria bacterium]|nr:MAG: hypothetical protein DRH27_03025 [Candidatus Falkowbacteria bacterium]
MAKKITIDDLAVIVKKKFDKTNKEIGGMKKDIVKIKATMVTKDYLDEKMADLRGDLVVLIRKEDNKVRKLLDVLQKRKVISLKETKEILAMEPFPELSL